MIGQFYASFCFGQSFASPSSPTLANFLRLAHPDDVSRAMVIDKNTKEAGASAQMASCQAFLPEARPSLLNRRVSVIECCRTFVSQQQLRSTPHSANVAGRPRSSTRKPMPSTGWINGEIQRGGLPSTAPTTAERLPAASKPHRQKATRIAVPKQQRDYLVPTRAAASIKIVPERPRRFLALQ